MNGNQASYFNLGAPLPIGLHKPDGDVFSGSAEGNCTSNDVSPQSQSVLRRIKLRLVVLQHSRLSHYRLQVPIQNGQAFW
jgi:hypothetical protein